MAGPGSTIHIFEVFLGVFIGTYTFTGSVVAFGKLSARIGSRPVMLPGRHLINLAGIGVSFLLAVWLMVGEPGNHAFALFLVAMEGVASWARIRWNIHDGQRAVAR